jgi:hypothetical protein
MESWDYKECKERLPGPIDNATYKDKAADKEEVTNYTYKHAVAY